MAAPRRLVARGLLVVGGVLVALLLSEIIVSGSDMAPQVFKIRLGRYRLSKNPLIGFEPTPGFYYGRENSDLSYYDYYADETNTLGYRDREHAVEKKPGCYRVVVIGDSIASGLLIESFEDTFPAVLERRLRETGSDVEVINFGVSGYNTRQEVETLAEKGIPFAPDMVLIEYCLNDRSQVDGRIMERLLQEERTASYVARWCDRVFLSSALYRLMRYGSLPSPKIGEAERNRRLQLVAEDTVDESLAKLQTLAQQNGFSVLLVVFPFFDDLGAYQHTQHHERMRAVSSELGFKYLDLLPAMRKCQEQLKMSVSLDMCHPSVVGHYCAARAMIKVIALAVESRELAAPSPAPSS